MRILVAEDDAISRQVLEIALRKFKHEVVGVADGQEAWEAMGKEWFRVIISDWMMPRLDGLDFCRRVRQQKTQDYTYFILLTSRTRTHENLAEAMEAGVDDFLNKPFDRDEIMTRLRVAERILAYTTKIRQLEEILPICSYCKKIRNDQNYWQRMEEYFNQHAGTDFSHSICPECYEKFIQPQLEELRAQMQASKTT